MRTILLWCTVMLWSAGAFAQRESIVTELVEVRFTGVTGDCRTAFPAESISLVVNGDENDAAQIYRDPRDPCRWTGSANTSFDVGAAFLSLRLNGRRTECRDAEVKVKGDRELAVVTYEPAGALAKTLVVEGPKPVSYLRRVHGRRQCTEWGWYTPLAIRDVDFTLESIVLQAGFPEPDLKRSGLILEPLSRGSEASETWKHFARTARRDGDTWTLTAAQYAAVYAHQESTLPLPEQVGLPRVPGCNADLEYARLRVKNVKTIRLTFK
jgi:hypothetical protein